MSTFKYKINYLSTVFNETQTDVVKKRVEKVVQFKELDETNIEQHDLHFKIFSLYRTKTSEFDTSVVIDTKILRELTVESIKLLVILDTDFTHVDLKEFLTSSLALLKFGLWFAENHILPFIRVYNTL